MLRHVGSASLIGLVVLFGTPLGAQHGVQLNFQSIDVSLPGVTRTTAFGLNAEGDIVGGYTMAGAGHSYVQ